MQHHPLTPMNDSNLVRVLGRQTGGKVDSNLQELALLWVLNLSDGSASLLDIAERAEMPFEWIETAAERLSSCGLLRMCE